jgi:hypothetical protein
MISQGLKKEDRALQPSLHHVLPDGRVGMPARGAAGRHTSEIKFNLKHLSKGRQRNALLTLSIYHGKLEPDSRVFTVALGRIKIPGGMLPGGLNRQLSQLSSLNSLMMG